MELNELRALLTDSRKASQARIPCSFALSPEAVWACTTCGACIEVCPVQNEQMLDIIDIRRNQVMIEGEFPAQLQSCLPRHGTRQESLGHQPRAADGLGRGLNVKTIDQNPEPDVLFWVGCAPSYDPQSQKTARALVQLLDSAEVDYRCSRQAGVLHRRQRPPRRQ